MEKEFVPYQEALALKQLGFNEPCFGSWEIEKTDTPTYTHSITTSYKNSNHPIGKTAAPTYSQAFRWFRDKHNIDAWVQPFMMEKHGKPFLPDESYGYWIFKDGVLVVDEVDFLNPEEAELACLEKLIELVKN